jgi:alpha-galactosidase
MWKLISIRCCLLGALALFQSCDNTNNRFVKVNLYTNNKSIESSVQIENGIDGQKYISISLTNRGKETDNIDSIEITIEPSLSVNQNTPLMFGGSCMGRTPIKQSTTSDSKSKSGTFVMIKHEEKSYSYIGLLSWNTFLPYIHYSPEKGIVIKADGEKKPVKPGETIEFEKFVITNGESWQDLMFDYGTEIAKEHNIKPKEPVELKGWSTWDYYGRVYDTKDVYKNIDRLKYEFDANIVQIDGGWWTARGDYLSVRKNLQGGMKAIADYAKSKGYKAGIHLDGFRGDKNSELYRNHPDWFLKDQDGEVICQEIDRGDAFMQYIYYDYSNPQVCDYMKNVFQTIKNDWGYSYFKIDFMRYGLLESILAEHGNNTNDIKKVTKINSFNENMTSVERTRAGLKAMREGMGDAYFLACSAIFGPTFGIVDGLRTGADICPTFDYYKRCTLGNAGNFYLNQTVVQNDADYLVVRNKDDEEPERAWGVNKFGGNTTFDEAKMWSDYIALYGGPKINSDNLLTLRPERKTLIDNAFAYKTAKRFIPLDMWSHAKDSRDAFNVILAENEDGVYISLFNWDETDRNFDISGFSDTKVIDTSTKSNLKLKNSNLQITLKSHSSLILKVENSNFDVLRNKLQIL